MAHFDATKSNIKNFISFTEISRVFHLQPKMAQTHLRFEFASVSANISLRYGQKEYTLAMIILIHVSR